MISGSLRQILRIEPGIFIAKVEVWAGAAQLRRMPSPALLVADYVNPNMAVRLRDAGVQFIDAAGNAYLNQKTWQKHG